MTDRLGILNFLVVIQALNHMNLVFALKYIAKRMKKITQHISKFFLRSVILLEIVRFSEFTKAHDKE